MTFVDARSDTLDFRPTFRQTMAITEQSLEGDGDIPGVKASLESDQEGTPSHLHRDQRGIHSVTGVAFTMISDCETRVIPTDSHTQAPARAIGSCGSSIGQPDGGDVPSNAVVRR